ncbi:MAG: complex I NDUFA9 subunit family protein [Xanthomonadales bacterium]|nr:complex I NDUFA9 subunit family protein [Xanthomonadales bacterium]
MRIVLLGGSGFLGRYVLRALTDDGHHCEVLTRNAAHRSTLNLLPGVHLVQADVYDKEALANQFSGADAVISMAGILNESGRGGKGFHKAHVELVRSVIDACHAAGVSRLLHVSALNAGEGSSHYLQSKGQAEDLLLAADDLNVSIFQPSVIFGRGDEFFNRFAMMLRLAPVMPLACPNARLQPVYAGDVATAIAAALDDPMTWGKRFELAGPLSYSLKELVKWTADTIGARCVIVGLPRPLSAAMAAVMNLVPGKPLSWDNYKSLQTDNTSDANDLACFGVEPKAIDLVVPDYLTGSVHQRRLQSFRKRPPV